MMLVDKSYYDYDFEHVKAKIMPLTYEDTVKSQEETYNLLAKFGIGTKKELSIEELQELAMKKYEQN